MPEISTSTRGIKTGAEDQGVKPGASPELNAHSFLYTSGQPHLNVLWQDFGIEC